MDISCSLDGIIDVYYPKQGALDIKNAGFENILLDFRLFCSSYELENIKQMEKMHSNRGLIAEQPIELHSAVTPLVELCKKQGIHTRVAYAPHFPRNSKQPIQIQMDIILQLAKESIKAAAKNGCEYIVIRPLFLGMEKGQEWEINKIFYLNLVETGRENKITILLENQCSDVNGHLVRGICTDAKETAKWIDTLNLEAAKLFEKNVEETKFEQFGFCMDVGVCTLCGQDMYDFGKMLGKRIKVVILRDCDRNIETSMLPFTYAKHRKCQTDWLSLIRGLREINFDGELILDFADTAASFSPILKSYLISLAKKVGDYFKWQIGIENVLKKYHSVVLFGAGNMCRNYMRCYGEKYPPLFTCDNNSKLWGTEFCGLEVKSPEELKTLPSDCMILICNVYYREIEQQIQEMGIKNNIEYFNDEYMQSFYYDRINKR